jgi:hyaluronan synthase
VKECFPVTIRAARGALRKAAVRGLMRDYDAEGACVRSLTPVRAGTEVRVSMRLPRSISTFFRGLECEIPARVRLTRPERVPGRGHEVVLSWSVPLARAVQRAISSYQRKIGAMLAVVLASTVALKLANLDFFWYAPYFYVYSATLVAYLVSRFYISWLYAAPPLRDYAPTLSIVISVRNEEKSLERTIEACFAADYPEGRREVIVVDDGSTDGTPRVLAAMKARHPELRVATLKASGKRYGMAEGVRMARGEIVVFVDSDTFIFSDALRHIVSGFEDPEVGASAGYAEVENADVNLLTGLQEVRYFVSYRLLKSSEGVFGCVSCCPGCLSAYRRSYVLEVLEPWLKQTFLGAPATFGDDRSLTNFILRKYRVLYNGDAMASTMVPESWGTYMRQQVRWKKSWLRETLIASRFMYAKHPVAALSFYATAAFSLLSPAMVVRAVFLGITERNSVLSFYVLGLALVALLQSLYFLYKRPSPNWALGMVWMACSLVLSGPQTYYAMLTIRRNHWGTR